MKCISCSTEISSKMRAALHSNACPFCGADIMDPKKAKQYSSLVGVLTSTKFTNKEEVDSKIKEKVIEVLVENFEFTRISKSPKREEVISVDESSEEEFEEIEEEDQEPPHVEQQPARAPRNLTKVKPRRPAVAGNAIYHQVQSDMYEDQGDSYDDIDDVSPEERAELERYFQDTTPAEIREKVEARLAASKKVTSSASSGIKRLR